MSCQHSSEYRSRGRRPGKTTTKEEILRAAAGLFAQQGYKKTTIKDIATAAGVDAKLVHYHFGTKRELFKQTIEHVYQTIGLFQLFHVLSKPAASHTSPGTDYVRSVLTALEETEYGRLVRGILWHATGDDDARGLLIDLVTQKIIPGITQHIPTDRPDDRTILIGTQMLGLVMARYILRVPRATQLSIDQIAKAVGPSLDLYLTRDLTGK